MQNNQHNKLSNIYEKQEENQQNQNDQQSTAQLQLNKTKTHHSHLKILLSIILIFLSTYSAQIQIQYHGPFIRTIQQHQSQDIYQASDVIYYRTQEYKLGGDIEKFYEKYLNTMGKMFYEDSFFYVKNGDQKSKYEKIQRNILHKNNNNINVTIMAIYQTQTQQTSQQKQQYFTSLPFHSQIHSKNPHTFVFISCPKSSLPQIFNLTFFTKTFYQYIKKIQIITSEIIKYRQSEIKLEIKVINTFESYLMMEAKVETNVIDIKTKEVVKGQAKQQENEKQSSQNNLGIRKLPQHHYLNTDFQYVTWVIFIVNAVLFYIELMVIINTNRKIQQNLNPNINTPQQQQQIQSTPNSTPTPTRPLISYSFFSQQQPQTPLLTLTSSQRINIIGRYSIIQLLISFLIFFSFQQKGLVCLFCWTKLSVILSSTGNKMMIGFLFKNALPMLLKIILNVILPLMGFVFFSMVVYKSTRKFQYLQLGFYQYIFNYFQYGIYQNFLPISKYGSFYTFTYFLQLFFLVSVGNNILQSILAQQVLKNSNLKSLTEFIENIQVECPICGCPPEIKKKIKIKMKNQNNRQNRFISKYFQQSQRQVNKSKYEIKIASPQFSPMFHKSQLNKKQFQLKKRQFPHPQRKFSQDQPLNITPPFSPKSVKKKVKFQIGSQLKVNQKYTRKQDIFAKKIITKTEILNKVFSDYNSIISVSSSVNKYFYSQVLKKKIQQLKKFETEIIIG